MKKLSAKVFIKAFVAYEQNEIKGRYFETFRRGFLSDQIPEIDLGGSAPEESSNKGNSKQCDKTELFWPGVL